MSSGFRAKWERHDPSDLADGGAMAAGKCVKNTARPTLQAVSFLEKGLFSGPHAPDQGVLCRVHMEFFAIRDQ